MSDVNVVIISGRLTRDPQTRTTPSGVTVCDLGIASNRYSSNKEQFTTFVRVTLWKKQAEWAGEFLHVGDTIQVQGQLFDDNFEKDGQKTSGRLKIDNARVNLLRRKQVEDNESQSETPVEVPEV